MCGAVSATENTTGGANDSYVPVSISGKVLDCVTNQPFANVTVKATNDGEEMARTITDNYGKYELNFSSQISNPV